MTLHDHISRRFDRLFRSYRKELARTRKSRNADAIHDVRVASRRILETIRVFRDCLDSKVSAPVEKGLKRWMRRTNKVRDLDVIVELGEMAENPGLAPVLEGWRAKRESRLGALLVTSENAKTSFWDGAAKPKDLLGAAAARRDSSLWDLSLSAAENASLALPFLVERYVRAGNGIEQQSADDQVYHSFRLRTKRVRYTIESFENIYPPAEFAEVLAVLKEFQQLLGALHDCSVATKTAEKAVKYGPEAAKASAEFCDFLQARSRLLQSEWHRKWSQFSGQPALKATCLFLREGVTAPRRRAAAKAS